jgi:hypothetical protein
VLGTACRAGMILRRHPAPETPFMTPLEIIRREQADTLIDEDGKVITLELLLGLTQTELRDFARR